MKGFLIKSLLFLLCFFALDKALLLLRNRLPERELDKRLEQIITGKINADIVVMGSSRGARDIVASQLADSLHTTAYNISYPGSNIFFHEYLLKELLKNGNKKPSLIVLAVDDPSEVGENELIRFRLDRLYPLVKYESIRNTLIEAGEKDKILSQLFIVHQLSISSFDLRKKRFKEQDTLLADGSMPIRWQSKKFNRKFSSRTVAYDQKKESVEKLTSFNNFLKLCRENDIKLLLACAPNFGDPTIGFKDRMTALKGSSHVMMYDTTNSIYKNADYYFDPGHLQLNGATIFTAEIVEYIKSNILSGNMDVAKQE
jgi:hypothetical protein